MFRVQNSLTKGQSDSKRQLFSLLPDAARPAEIFQHLLFWFQIPASAVICVYKLVGVEMFDGDFMQVTPF